MLIFMTIYEFYILDNKWKQVQQSPAFIWVVEQSAFGRAYKSAFKSEFGKDSELISNEEVIAERTAFWLKKYDVVTRDEYVREKSSLSGKCRISDLEIDNTLDERNSEDVRLERFKRSIKRSLGRTRGRWWADLLTSLYQYYYGDIYDGDRKTSKVQKDLANDVLISAQKLLEHFNSGVSASISIDQRASVQLPKNLTRLNMELEDFIDESGNEFKPIKRIDSTAKERLFIYNLWEMFQRQRGWKKKPLSKATAINHLLSLEGINTPIEQRAIEKLIQGWNKEKRDLRMQISKESDNDQLKRYKLKRKYGIL